MLCHHLATVVKKLINVKYFRLGAVSGLLLLCTIMLGTSNDSQNSLFAQDSSSVVPDIETSGVDRVFPTTSPSADYGETNDGSIDSSSSNGDRESQSTTQEEDETSTASEEDETSTEEEQEGMNTGLERAIMVVEMTKNTISEAFSAAGLPILGSDE